jgi:hypothetical protein
VAQVKRTFVRRRPAARPERRIPRRPAGEAAPLSFGQEQLWLHSQLAPDAPLYTESLTLRRTGPLDPELLSECFAEVTRRYEIWRTTFPRRDGHLVQEVRDGGPRLAVTDLRHLPDGDREAHALRLAAEDLERPFDLSREPGVRARLVTLSDTDHRLFLCLHHMIFDGISVYHVLLPELAGLYQARMTGTPPVLEEPALQYADYAHWQRRQDDEPAFDRLASHWRTRLAGAPATIALPTDRPRPPSQSFRGGLVRLDLPAELTAAARETAAREHCTLFMLLLAGFAATLHQSSAQTDMVIGSVSGGRDHPELERVVGYLARMLVLRLDLSGDPSFRELLSRVREVLMDALCHEGLPFQRMVRALGPARDLSRSPLFQVTFSIEPPLPDLRPGWDISEMDAGPMASKFDLSIELEDRGDGIHVRAIYALDLFEGATVTRLLDDWRRLLTRAVSAPEQHLDDLAGTALSDEYLA